MTYYSTKEKKIDIVTLCVLPIFASILATLFRLNFFVTTLIFYGLPILYLLRKTRDAFWRTLGFTIPFSLLAGTIFDYFAIKDNSWFVPTIFPIHVFSLVPVEDIVWGFFFCFFIVLFYEHFFDKGKHKKINSHMKLLIILLACLFVIFATVILTIPNVITIPYFYTWTGVVMLPVIVILWIFPHLYTRLLKSLPYFVLIGVLNEITALNVGHWTYTGKHFIGWVQIMQYRFPFEELFYWIILFAVMIMSYFEFFDDTRKHLRKVE